MDAARLAAKAGLGLSTIVDFERSRRHVSAEAIQAIRWLWKLPALNSSTKTAVAPACASASASVSKTPK